jgi:hypothetical protein
MESEIPESVAAEAEMQKGLELMVKDVISEGSSTAAKLEGKLRDPFWVPTPATSAPDAEEKELSVAAENDDLAEIVRGMSLDATMIQGRQQLAVIDGRVYSRGQRIAIPGDESRTDRSLTVVAVTRTSVLLRGETKHYSLGYPEQLGKKKEDADSESAKEQAISEIDGGAQMEMFQRLLKSPLGKMGQGVLGKGAGAGRSADAAAKGRGRRGSNSPARSSGSGGA